MMSMVTFRLSKRLLLALVVIGILTGGCRKRVSDGATAGQTTDKGLTPVDPPLAAFQSELLDLAFRTATAIPAEPHIKDRSRAQEAVVATCLKLDQPRRALGYLEGIDNWRRGSCYADLALYSVRRGLEVDVQHYLDLAAAIANEDIEAWRRDHIRVKIAQVYASRGQMAKAAALESGLPASESGKVDRVKAMVCTQADFHEHIAVLDGLVASGDFDATHNALGAYAQMFNRFYADPARRAMLEDRITTGWAKLPISIRIDLLVEMGGFALGHDDPSSALRLTREARGLLDAHQWRLEHRMPLAAKLITLHFRAGDPDRACADAEALRVLFDAEKEQIVNIYRAGALRSLAEAYQAMGDTPSARAVYRRAVEEGIANPNSRPRAEDLSATCCSMALGAVEPDAELWTRLREISEALGPPW